MLLKTLLRVYTYLLSEKKELQREEPMYLRVRSELYASIATLDRLKKMYDIGVVDISSFRREADALITDVRERISEMRRIGLDFNSFAVQERITDEFPDAAEMLGFRTVNDTSAAETMTKEEYFNYLGLAVLDVATAHASKGLMSLAELIVEVSKLLPNVRPINYNDVIRAVNMVAEHGLIPGIRTLQCGVKVVELRPLELRRDQADVVNLAASKGFTTIEEVMMQLNWSKDHAAEVLNSLVDAGMAVADKRYSSGFKYWFPGLRSRKSESEDGTSQA